MAIWASGWRRFKGLNHVSFGLRRVVKSKAMKGAESIKKEILWLGKRCLSKVYRNNIVF